MHEDGPPNAPARDRETLLPERDRDTNPEDLSLPSNAAMLDPDAMRAADTDLMAAVKVILQTGRELAEERETRRKAAEQSALNQATLIKQQGEVIEILRRTESATEANHKILKHHIDELNRALDHHGDQIRAHGSQIAEFHVLRSDMASSVAVAIEQALAPYVKRIEAIERRFTTDS